MGFDSGIAKMHRVTHQNIRDVEPELVEPVNFAGAGAGAGAAKNHRLRLRKIILEFHKKS
jgi:hypothetical protein